MIGRQVPEVPAASRYGGQNGAHSTEGGRLTGDGREDSGVALGWVISDAWVLAAVRICGSPEVRAGLFDLVAACDAMNQLIVSCPELEHALSLLVGAGLVVADEDGIAVTPAGRDLVTRAGRLALVGGGRATPAARGQALLTVLQDVPVRPVPFEIDAATYQAACLEYQHTRRTELRTRR